MLSVSAHLHAALLCLLETRQQSSAWNASRRAFSQQEGIQPHCLLVHPAHPTHKANSNASRLKLEVFQTPFAAPQLRSSEAPLKLLLMMKTAGSEAGRDLSRCHRDRPSARRLIAPQALPLPTWWSCSGCPDPAQCRPLAPQTAPPASPTASPLSPVRSMMSAQAIGNTIGDERVSRPVMVTQTYSWS